MDFTLTSVNNATHVHHMTSPSHVIQDVNKDSVHLNKQSQDKLVLAHLKFVFSIANKLSGYGLREEDLVQEGNIGLIKAAKRFDPSKNNAFSTFAVFYVKAEMFEFILKNWRIVKIATTKSQRKLFFNLRSMKDNLDSLNQEKMNHISKKLNVSIDDVRSMESRLSNKDCCFDNSEDDKAETNDRKFPAMHLADNNSDISVQFEINDFANHQKLLLKSALNDLDERSRYIISSRWLIEDKLTLNDLAKKYDVSRERIRQIEKNSFAKLKLAISESLH